MWSNKRGDGCVGHSALDAGGVASVSHPGYAGHSIAQTPRTPASLNATRAR
jgi:hypothetical protein